MLYSRKAKVAWLGLVSIDLQLSNFASTSLYAVHFGSSIMIGRHRIIHDMNPNCNCTCQTTSTLSATDLLCDLITDHDRFDNFRNRIHLWANLIGHLKTSKGFSINNRVGSRKIWSSKISKTIILQIFNRSKKNPNHKNPGDIKPINNSSHIRPAENAHYALHIKSLLFFPDWPLETKYSQKNRKQTIAIIIQQIRKFYGGFYPPKVLNFVYNTLTKKPQHSITIQYIILGRKMTKFWIPFIMTIPFQQLGTSGGVQFNTQAYSGGKLDKSDREICIVTL